MAKSEYKKMKFKCPKCGKILERELPKWSVYLTPKGYYRSFCGKAGKRVACRPIKNSKEKRK